MVVSAFECEFDTDHTKMRRQSRVALLSFVPIVVLEASH